MTGARTGPSGLPTPDVDRDGDEITYKDRYAGETRETRFKFGRTPDGSEQKVVVYELLAGENRPDIVGLTETRFHQVLDLLNDPDRDRAEFDEQFAADDDDEVLEGTTKVETGDCALVSQVIDDEPRSLGTVTLTRDHLHTVAAEFGANDEPEVEG